jgi:hypothetical protein
MRRLGWIAGSGAAVVALVLAWLAIRESASSGASAEGSRPVDEPERPSSVGSKRRAGDPVDEGPSSRRSPRKLDPDEQQRRARVRAQILEAQRARDAATGNESLSPAPGSPDDEPERPPGNLNKRIEGHDELVAELNRDFMPLASECIDEALARNPELAGMLAIEFEVVADEDLGAVVDTVEFPPNADQVVEDELQVCVRETLLSTLLPPGAANGREALMLTLPVEADEE